MSSFKKAIIVANGTPQKGKAVQSVIADSSNALVIGADGGADLALQMGLSPSIIVGDMDSIRPDTLASLEANRAQILRHSPHKNETDLELALLEAITRGADEIYILGALGNRIDHTISNIYLLTLPALQSCKACLVDDNQTLWLVRPGTHRLFGRVDDTISLIPFQSDIEGISTNGLKYPLRDETLAFGPARGVSNVLISTEASVTFKRGTLLIIHIMMGHA